MDIEQWQQVFGFTALSQYPKLPCPCCGKISLSINEDTLQFKEISREEVSLNSKKYTEQKNKSSAVISNLSNEFEATGDPSFWQTVTQVVVVLGASIMQCLEPINGQPYQLVGFLQCDNCEKIVSANGLALWPLVEMSPDKKQEYHIKIEFFSPTIPIVAISENVPEVIKLELFDSFRYLHFDPSASAAKLRRAIECFCEGWDAKGKNLHQQICSLKEKHPEEAEYLESLKLVGNEGTHSNNIDEIDLLYSFEIFQFVLNLYDRQFMYKKSRDKYEALMAKHGNGKAQLRLPSDVATVI